MTTEHEGSEEGGEGLSAAEREALCFCADVHDCLTAADSDILKAACETHAKRVERILADRLAAVQAERDGWRAQYDRMRDARDVERDEWKARYDRAESAEAERDEIADRLSALLCDLTGGLMSNTGYSVRTMVRAIEAEFEKHATTDLADALARVESAETQLDELRGQHAETEWLLRMTYDARDRAERKIEAVEALAEMWERDDEESLNRFGQHLLGGSVLTCAEHLRAALANPSAAQREAKVGARECRYPCGLPDEPPCAGCDVRMPDALHLCSLDCPEPCPHVWYPSSLPAALRVLSYDSGRQREADAEVGWDWGPEQGAWLRALADALATDEAES